jgi:hypothetical protein
MVSCWDGWRRSPDRGCPATTGLKLLRWDEHASIPFTLGTAVRPSQGGHEEYPTDEADPGAAILVSRGIKVLQAAPAAYPNRSATDHGFYATVFLNALPLTRGPSMARKSPKSIQVDANVRCQRIYPVEDTRKEVSQLKTIGIRMTRDQAIHLARVLLAVSQEWRMIDITGRRFKKRQSDGTYELTVTSNLPEADNGN